MSSPVPILSVNHPSHEGNSSKLTGLSLGKEQARAHYQTIGRVLLCAEASCYCVGVPWLPPSKDTEQACREFRGTLEEFLRLSLLSVPTAILEAYCDDLERFDTSTENLAELNIAPLSFAQRYAFAAIVFFILLSTDYFVCRLLGLPLAISIFSACFVAGIVAAVIALISGDFSRMRSFYALLNKEIARRKGQDKPGGKTVPLVGVEIEPLPE